MILRRLPADVALFEASPNATSEESGEIPPGFMIPFSL
jgi:hypothetical protein